MKTIQQVVEERNVKYMLHFTRVENIPGILEYGIYPRNQFNVLPRKPVVSDTARYDELLDYSNLSIMFPNYLMWYQKKKQESNLWVLLVIDVALMWERECLFSPDNSARKGGQIHAKRGVEALETLYNESEGEVERQELKIPDSYPTNPQAEVLVPGIIDPSYIKAIVVEDIINLESLKRKIDYSIEVIANRRLYGNRQDYWYWREKKEIE